MKAPAFQFYPKDFLADANVMAMNMEERGCHITLLCACWNERSGTGRRAQPEGDSIHLASGSWERFGRKVTGGGRNGRKVRQASAVPSVSSVSITN